MGAKWNAARRVNQCRTAALIGRSRGSLQSPSNCFQMWAASPGSNQPASNTEPFDCTQTWPVRQPNRPAPPQARWPGFSEFVCKSELTSEYASVSYTCPCMFSRWTSLIGEKLFRNLTLCSICVQQAECWRCRECQEAPALWSAARNQTTLFTESTTFRLYA